MPTDYQELIKLIKPLANIQWRECRKLPDWFCLKQPTLLSALSSENLLQLIKASNENYIVLQLTIEFENLWQSGASLWPHLAITEQSQLADYWQEHQNAIRRELLHPAKLHAEQNFILTLCQQLPELKSLPLNRDEHFAIIDPGARSGIKLVTADAHGEEVSHSIIFPHEPQNQWQQGLRKFSQFIATTRAKKLVMLSGEGFPESRRFLQTWLNEQETPLLVYTLPESGLDVLCQRASHDITDTLYLRARQAARLAALGSCCYSDLPLQTLISEPLKTVVNPWLLATALQRQWQKQSSDTNHLKTDPLYTNQILDLSDLKHGQCIKGQIINKAEFGYFVDIGIELNGLLHNSQIQASDNLAIGEVITVYIDKVNTSKAQFSLSRQPLKSKPKRHNKTKKPPAPGNSAMADALQAALKKQS